MYVKESFLVKFCVCIVLSNDSNSSQPSARGGVVVFLWSPGRSTPAACTEFSASLRETMLKGNSLHANLLASAVVYSVARYDHIFYNNLQQFSDTKCVSKKMGVLQLNEVH